MSDAINILIQSNSVMASYSRPDKFFIVAVLLYNSIEYLAITEWKNKMHVLI